ncbi:diguanylate cyclase (GGDEF) domain protein [Bordetella bronchiseptica MBORD665]|nr:diguanylate cyclase (GGDEF) domain protein [Bordetella bronchiseptica 3E44]KDC80886.1 diguanylate cyclase (GGDEF) domain protein [Bordetella bronchiseptica MBORD665]KDC82179.1 diguanylate cyclase (GGDEF) domain protein [Bordetella bronchiseptica MBORD668]KDD56567.1 diguanylate cyclase (GGDEF) domain protein [Bordetella bronchiseptica RB630]
MALSRPARLLSRIGMVTALGIVAALGIVIAVASILAQDRQQVWEREARSARNVLQALAGEFERTVTAYDLVIRGVIGDLAQPAVAAMGPEALHRLLFQQGARPDNLAVLLVLDERGEVILDSRTAVVAPRNRSRRDYFQAHVDNPQAGLFISKPYRSRNRNGELSIALSRRLAHPDGSFAGVVVAAVSLSYFRDRVVQLNVGPRGSMTLFRDDGIVISRKPYVEAQIGVDLSESANVSRFRREGRGAFVGTAILDGVERLYQFERVGKLPLIMVVALSTDDMMTPWRRHAWVLASAVLLLCALLVALLAALERELRRRRNAEAELAQLARIDTLSGLLNRRAFAQVLALEWEAALRGRTPLALLLVDVDHFKAYYDCYGRSASDVLLRRVADAVRDCVPYAANVVARHGADEFVVLLPGMGLRSAAWLAERVRARVLGLAVPHRGNRGGVVSVSIGCTAMTPLAGSEAAVLVERADAALYLAKSRGRNRVERIGDPSTAGQGAEREMAQEPGGP